jgi:uncharacterized membrane protein YbjE (DUF340 family)
MDNFIEFVRGDVFIHYILTFFGAFAMYVFSLNKGFKGATPFLKKILPGNSQVFYDRLDFLFVVISGSIIGYVFFSPSNPLEALAAGFGWVGAMNILMSSKEE